MQGCEVLFMILGPTMFLKIIKSELVGDSFDRLFMWIVFPKVFVLLLQPVETSDSLRLAMIVDDSVA